MLHPSDRQATVPTAVRDGQMAPITCAACGCRLEAAVDRTWHHFNPLGGRDARGCRVPCADLVHGANGLPLDA